MSYSKSVTESSFEVDVIDSPLTVVVDFWAEWCGPCRALAPVLDEIAAAHPEHLTVVKVNVDENPGLAMQYRIASIPALKVFSDGKVVKTILGTKPKVMLEADLADFIGLG